MVIKRTIDRDSWIPSPSPGHKYLVLSFSGLQNQVKPCDLKRYYKRLDPIFFVVGQNYCPIYGTYPRLADDGYVVISSRNGYAWIDVIRHGVH